MSIDPQWCNFLSKTYGWTPPHVSAPPVPDTTGQCRIETRATHLQRWYLSAFYHHYLIFTDSLGVKFKLEGGQHGDCPGTPVDESQAPWAIANPDHSHAYVKVDSTDGHAAAASDDKSIEAAPLSVDTCGYWSKLDRAMTYIRNSCTYYEPYATSDGGLAKNSNTAAWTMLSRAGLPTTSPLDYEGVAMRVFAPGWGYDIDA